MNEILSVSREEKKALLSLEDRLYLLRALDKLLIPDAYGDYNGYQVRSLYFDDMCNSDFWDKENGEISKNRIRLRIYHTTDATAKFEIKRKLYARQKKESVTITREHALALQEGNYEVLENYTSPTAAYGWKLMRARCYRPVCVIAYDRRAYTHPDFNTRVTIDSRLRCCDTRLDLFSDSLNFYSLLRPDQSILEIKYDRFLFRQLQDVLKNCDLTRHPPSKFGSARKKVMEYAY